MKLKHYLLLGAALLLLAGCFFLPNTVAGITDSRRLDNLVMIDSQSVNFETAPELALPERIALVASPTTELLALKTGKVMDFETAGGRVVAELVRFFTGGPFKFAADKSVMEECTAAFVIDSENPSINIIVWEIVLSDLYGNVVNVTMDDETGMILKLIYRFGSGGRLPDGAQGPSAGIGQTDEEFRAAALRLTEMMASYYGLTITLADYKFSGSLAYYRADISGDKELIPMYGVVRASDFTMNEKLLY